MAPGLDRTRKLAAKAARRKAVVATKRQAERLAASPAGKVAAEVQGPVERCLRLREMFSVGIGHLIIARRLPSGPLGIGFFLIDVDPSAAKKLVTESVAYAAESGIAPAKDYRVTSRIFGDIDTSTDTFTFGVNGRPLYVQGPRDSPGRIREIMGALNRHRGAGRWDATLVTGGDILDAESLPLDAEGFPIDSDDPDDEDDVPAIEDHRAEGPESPDEDGPNRRS